MTEPRKPGPRPKPKPKLFHLLRPPTSMLPIKTYCGIIGAERIGDRHFVGKSVERFHAVSADDMTQGSNCGQCKRTVAAMKQPRFNPGPEPLKRTP